jgi:hypothetical protein
MKSRLFLSNTARLMGISVVALVMMSTIHRAVSAPLPPQASGGIKILTKSVDDGVAGAPYVSQAFEAMGGKLPYTWTATGLPEGLSFGISDIIHGRTDKVGTFPIVVTVTDSKKPTPLTATAKYTIKIGPPRAK